MKVMAAHVLVEPDTGIQKWESKVLSGVIYVIPRHRITKTILDGETLDCDGVYLLIGNGKIRVGKGNIYTRLCSHARSSDSNMNFFDYAIVVTGDEGLDPNQQGYMEHIWIKKLKDNGKYSITNDNSPIMPSIRRNEIIETDHYIETAEPIIEACCGEKIFEKSSIVPNVILPVNNPILVQSTSLGLSLLFECKNSWAHGKGEFSQSQKTMKVLKGSMFRLNVVQSCKKRYTTEMAIREKLINGGKLVHQNGGLILTEDWEFTSSSAASTIILGTPSNGRDDWKQNGKSLNEILYKKV